MGHVGSLAVALGACALLLHVAACGGRRMGHVGSLTVALGACALLLNVAACGGKCCHVDLGICTWSAEVAAPWEANGRPLASAVAAKAHI